MCRVPPAQRLRARKIERLAVEPIGGREEIAVIVLEDNKELEAIVSFANIAAVRSRCCIHGN